MGLESAYGIGSLKPGVCTSTTRPAVPFDGQTISETDTDSLQVYKGTAWAPASALTFIASASPSAVGSISFNSCFSATYANYLIFANFTASVGANAEINMRLRVGGTDATTNYNWNLMNSPSSAGAPTTTASLGAALFNFTQIDPTYNVSATQCTLFDPFTTNKTLMSVNTQTHLSTGRYDNRLVTGYNSNATSYDGFSLITTGTSFTGTIRVYGYSNS